MTAARIGLALTALVAAAWFALGIRQSTSLGHAEATVGLRPASLSAAEIARATAELNEAGTLNPDRTVGQYRVRLLLDAHRPQAARALALQLTAAEPQNIESWVALAQTASTDVTLFDETLRRIHALEPRLP
jgi:hypothetical protein